MGKGDKRTLRGKINAASYGNKRPKPQKVASAKKAKAIAAAKQRAKNPTAPTP